MASALELQGKVSPVPDSAVVNWVAAAPPDRRTSFSGSGLPFGSKEQAMRHAQRGQSRVAEDGSYVIRLDEVPNSYYRVGGVVLHPPEVVLQWERGGEVFERAVALRELAEPGRSLYPAPLSALPRSVTRADGVLTQEEYLLLSAYRR